MRIPYWGFLACLCIVPFCVISSSGQRRSSFTDVLYLSTFFFEYLYFTWVSMTLTPLHVLNESYQVMGRPTLSTTSNQPSLEGFPSSSGPQGSLDFCCYFSLHRGSHLIQAGVGFPPVQMQSLQSCKAHNYTMSSRRKSFFVIKADSEVQFIPSRLPSLF